MSNTEDLRTSREKLDAEIEGLELTDEVRRKLADLDGVLLDIVAGSRRQGDFLTRVLKAFPDMTPADMNELQFVTDYYRARLKKVMRPEGKSDNAQAQVIG